MKRYTPANRNFSDVENTEGNYHVVRLIDDVLAFAYYGKEKARGPVSEVPGLLLTKQRGRVFQRELPPFSVIASQTSELAVSFRSPRYKALPATFSA